MTAHRLKVDPAYWGALVDGTKRFEVRRNDRGYQRGDTLELRQWDAIFGWGPDITLTFEVTFVYSGDPRFGGIERGYVVLGLAVIGL